MNVLVYNKMVSFKKERVILFLQCCQEISANHERNSEITHHCWMSTFRSSFGYCNYSFIFCHVVMANIQTLSVRNLFTFLYLLSWWWNNRDHICLCFSFGVGKINVCPYMMLFIKQIWPVPKPTRLHAKIWTVNLFPISVSLALC